MKSNTAITVIPSAEGFIDELVPAAVALIVDRLANAVGPVSNHTQRAYMAAASGKEIQHRRDGFQVGRKIRLQRRGCGYVNTRG